MAVAKALSYRREKGRRRETASTDQILISTVPSANHGLTIACVSRRQAILLNRRSDELASGLCVHLSEDRWNSAVVAAVRERRYLPWCPSALAKSYVCDASASLFFSLYRNLFPFSFFPP